MMLAAPRRLHLVPQSVLEGAVGQLAHAHWHADHVPTKTSRQGLIACRSFAKPTRYYLVVGKVLNHPLCVTSGTSHLVQRRPPELQVVVIRVSSLTLGQN